MDRCISIDDRRSSPRRRLLKTGTVVFDGGVAVCKVRNASETGAALELMNPAEIPDNFKLVVEADNFIRRCRVVWRSISRVGISFVSRE